MQELSQTTDKFIKEKSDKRIESIIQEIDKLQLSYDSKKSDREKIKILFEENKKLELQLIELENQAKDFEFKSDLEQASKIRY